ncbi:MAG: ankyrin repeat domain-containing protein [Bryobacterales bacterium]
MCFRLWLAAALLALAACESAAPPPQSAAPNLEMEQALRDAAFEGDQNKVQALLDNGVDVNAKDADMRTPLMLAAFEGKTNVVLDLLDAGAEINAQDTNKRTPLFFASSGPNGGTVEVLLDRGADVSTVDVEGWTALMAASHDASRSGRGAAQARRSIPSSKITDGDFSDHRVTRVTMQSCSFSSTRAENKKTASACSAGQLTISRKGRLESPSTEQRRNLVQNAAHVGARRGGDYLIGTAVTIAHFHANRAAADANLHAHAEVAHRLGLAGLGEQREIAQRPARDLVPAP